MHSHPTQPPPMSGAQHFLRQGAYTAEITSSGATLRTLKHGDRDLIVPFRADQMRPCFHGSVLAPWPNRLADGNFTHEGITHQLPLSEPERGNALHGLVAWQQWNIREKTPSSISLELSLLPQPGYPWHLELLTTYELSDTGLNWSVEALNAGTGNAPYGIGTHPYLSVGTGSVDEWTLHIPASQIVESTPGRLLPKAQHPVADFLGGTLDFRSARIVGAAKIDHAYTDLTPEEDTKAQVTVIDHAGIGTALSWDALNLPWLQVFTSDLEDPAINRAGVAVEAMTCAPDAFNNKQGLINLGAGEAHRAEWNIRAL